MMMYFIISNVWQLVIELPFLCSNVNNYNKLFLKINTRYTTTERERCNNDAFNKQNEHKQYNKINLLSTITNE